MRQVRPGRVEQWLALASGGWAVAFLMPDVGAVAVVAPLYAVAGLLCRQLPLVAGAIVVAGEVAQEALGVSGENPASTVAVVVVTFGLGRFRGDPVAAVPTVTLAVAMAGRDGFAVPTLVFVTVLLGTVWTVGLLVRRRAERSAAAAEEAAALGRTDPAAVAEVLVAEERARLAGEILDVVRTAVRTMQDDARAAAGPPPDPVRCAAVQNHGRRAVAELRRLLGLLRSEPAEAGAAQPPPAPLLQRSAWPVDLLIAAGAAAVVVVEWVTIGADRPWAAAALTLAFCAPLALLRTAPALTVSLASVPVALAIVLGQPLFHGFESVGIALLLGWTVGADGRRLSWTALAGWVLLVLVEVRLHAPGNEAILLACVGVGAVPGHLWSAHRFEERSARLTADELRARQAALADQAVRAERLRLARELHDVASHAIGVMVLQAGAAEVQCATDPGAALASLERVRTAGVQAQTELAVLFGLLDAGTVGSPGLAATATAPDLVDGVRTLVDRMRSGGLAVALDVSGDLPGEVASARTAYRVVQEALTNAVRHAPGSSVVVRLAREGDDLRVEVTDDGPAVEAGEGGFGLVGLAERVRGEGGSVAAGPRPGGGFTVSARLPLRSPSEAAP
jgi:signal transduction histidine kinase